MEESKANIVGPIHLGDRAFLCFLLLFRPCYHLERGKGTIDLVINICYYVKGN
jgi:hypothetical protein